MILLMEGKEEKNFTLSKQKAEKIKKLLKANSTNFFIENSKNNNNKNNNNNSK